MYLLIVSGRQMLTWSYHVEQGMYGTAIVFGIIAVIYTLRRLATSSSHQWVLYLSSTVITVLIIGSSRSSSQI